MTAALAAWGIYVCGGCAWDEKPEARERRVKKHKITHDLIDWTKGEPGELNLYARVNKHTQVYLNVWGNILYGYVGRDAGFTVRELQWAGEAFGIASCIKKCTNTSGNYIERQMGLDMWTRYGGDLSQGDIIAVINAKIHKLSQYCDAAPFPSNAPKTHCKW